MRPEMESSSTPMKRVAGWRLAHEVADAAAWLFCGLIDYVVSWASLFGVSPVF